MRVRDLGALVVAVGTQEQPVVGTRGAAMLALLAMNVNQRVSVDALMEAAWGDRVSAGSASTLASHMWRLRQLLEPARDRGQAPTVLVNDAEGYRLVGGPATVDSLLFAETAGEVRDLLATGHPHEAVRRADAALGLWRGQPYGVLSEADWARSAVARLEELRGQLQEHRVEGLLAAGSVDAALIDLGSLIETMPFREPLRALRMEALHRSGRTEEALTAYQEARRALLDEVGIEPGPELRAMHERILRGDPTLDTRLERRPPPPRPVEVHLPSTLTPLVGREETVSRLSDLVRPGRLVTITGAAGAGKTRVAVETARAVVDDFPDGVWFVDLTAVSDPDLVVDLVVSVIGFAASPGATPLQDLRRYLQARRVLLVLDNCEHVVTSVEKVVRVTLSDIGVAPGCAIVATSREPIDVEGETIWTLEPLRLPPTGAAPPDVAASPAVELFLQRLTAVVPTLKVDDDVLAVAAEISIAVDGLPLPLELAAARALSHSLDDIAAQVSVDPSRLGRVGRGRRDHRATVRSAIDWSHRLLTTEERVAHRRLSVLPGAFTARAAAAVVLDPGDGGAGVPDVDDLLAQLVHRSLLTSDGSAGHGRPTRFRQLTTVRSHAGHALDAAGETRLCLDRRDTWTAGLVASRPPIGTADEVPWHHEIDDDYAVVRATLARQLLDDPTPEGGRLAYPLTYYWYYRERLVEASRWLQLGHRALQHSEPADEALSRVALASALTLQRRLDLARPLLHTVDEEVKHLPPERLVEVGEELAGLAVAAYTAEAYDLVSTVHAPLRWVAETTSDADLDLLADAVQCCILLVTGRLDEAVRLAPSVYRRAEQRDHLAAGMTSTAPLIIGALMSHRPDDGIRWINRCARLQMKLGSGAIGMFTETRGNFAAQLGNYEQAARLYAAAQTVTRRAGMTWPNRDITRPLLLATGDNLTREEYEQAWQQGEQLSPSEVFAGHDDWNPDRA